MACTFTTGKSRAGLSSMKVCPHRTSPRSPKARDIFTLERTTVWYEFRNRNYNHEKSIHHDFPFADHADRVVGGRRRIDSAGQSATRSRNPFFGRDGDYRPDR